MKSFRGVRERSSESQHSKRKLLLSVSRQSIGRFANEADTRLEQQRKARRTQLVWLTPFIRLLDCIASYVLTTQRRGFA